MMLSPDALQGWSVCGTALRRPHRRRRPVCRLWLHSSCAASTTPCASLDCSAWSTPPAQSTNRKMRRWYRLACSRTRATGTSRGQQPFRPKSTCCFSCHFLFLCCFHRLIPVLPSWPERGLEPLTQCVRASTTHTLTHGFFVALLERRPPGSEGTAVTPMQ